MKSIWIVTTGSRGDVQPYVAVALELRKQGYDVRFFTNSSLVSLSKGFGIDTTAIAPDIKDVLGHTVEENPFIRGMANGNVQELTEGVKLLNQKSSSYIRDVILAEEKRMQDVGTPDLCIANIMSLGVAWYLALKYDIPFYELGCSDSTFNPDYAPGGLPTPPLHLHYYLMKYLIPMFKNDLNRPIVEALDRDLALKLKEAPTENTLDPVLQRGVLISPIIAKVLHPKASPKIHFLGCTVLGKDENVDDLCLLDDFGGTAVYDKLNVFLGSPGPKPIYIGWGSMMCKSPEHMLDLCVRAVHASKQRAIVLGGLADLSFETMEQTCSEASLVKYARSNMIFVKKAPHEWLFPKVALTIHHGGAGTTTAALRSGVPTIVTPLMTDQYDNAYAVNQLGNGVGLPQLHKVGWEELADTINTVINDESMAQKAAELAIQARKEDGAKAAVTAIQSYWTEVGKEESTFRQLWPGSRAPTLTKKLLHWCGLHK